MSILRSTDKTSNSAVRPGVRMRSMLSEVYKARGHATGKLWIHYSGKARCDVAFSSETAYLHFLYIESSFDIKRVDYTPALRVNSIVGDGFVNYINAELVMGNDDVIWRHLSTNDANEESMRLHSQLQLALDSASIAYGRRSPNLEILTLNEILASPLRIRNWHSIASWLAAGRDWVLTEEQAEISALIRSRGHVTFKDVIELGHNTERGDLYGVALFRSLQAGAYRCNLFDAPFTLRSIFAQKHEGK